MNYTDPHSIKSLFEEITLLTATNFQEKNSNPDHTHKSNLNEYSAAAIPVYRSGYIMRRRQN